MPELPEVETIRRDLWPILRGRKIANVEVRKIHLVRGDGHKALARDLTGRKITGISRRGKMLIFELEPSEMFLLMHLKMTGQLIFRDGKKLIAGGHSWPDIEEMPNKFSHVIFHFSGGAKLFFNDMRQFGYVHLVNKEERDQIIRRYGIEPLSAAFTPAKLGEILRGRRTALKKVLLDQTAMAGLGNIYVDEACFAAGVRPQRRAGRLKATEIKKLHHEIVRILKLSIKNRGTTFNTFRDGHGRRGNFVRLLKVYGRAGEQCRRCATGVIKRTVIGGRGTAFCPVCQK